MCAIRKGFFIKAKCLNRLTLKDISVKTHSGNIREDFVINDIGGGKMIRNKKTYLEISIEVIYYQTDIVRTSDEINDDNKWTEFY